MKICSTTVVIECSADELRQSNTLADSFVGILRKAFNGPIIPTEFSTDDKSEDEDESDDGE